MLTVLVFGSKSSQELAAKLSFIGDILKKIYSLDIMAGVLSDSARPSRSVWHVLRMHRT